MISDDVLDKRMRKIGHTPCEETVCEEVEDIYYPTVGGKFYTRRKKRCEKCDMWAWWLFSYEGDVMFIGEALMNKCDSPAYYGRSTLGDAYPYGYKGDKHGKETSN